jgi:hypothetical protein
MKDTGHVSETMHFYCKLFFLLYFKPVFYYCFGQIVFFSLQLINCSNLLNFIEKNCF